MWGRNTCIGVPKLIQVDTITQWTAVDMGVFLVNLCLSFSLQVLQKLPVTIAALKQGNMGKLIKQLSKADNPGQREAL